MVRMSSTPDRSLGLTGATNFRDLGGYVGRDGRPLRWRRLFRSDHMGALTDADLAQLATLGLARSFDFRGVDERAAMPNRLPGVQQHPLSIEPTVVQSLQLMRQSGQALTVAVVAAEMHTLYRSMINDQSQRFAELFEHLLQNDVPTVFHCTAGKDRTGLAAALTTSCSAMCSTGVRPPPATRRWPTCHPKPWRCCGRCRASTCRPRCKRSTTPTAASIVI
jgi:protein-tyrosine phosphatase